MILFIFEGKREEAIYKSMEALFFGSLPEGESIVRVYDGNIFDLYDTYEKYGGDVDIVSLLKDDMQREEKVSFPQKQKYQILQKFTCSSILTFTIVVCELRNLVKGLLKCFRHSITKQRSVNCILVIR